MHDRERLVYWIFVNLDEIGESQEAVDIAWRAEIRNRVKEIQDAKVRMIPADEMWKDLLKNYAQENGISSISEIINSKICPMVV